MENVKKVINNICDFINKDIERGTVNDKTINMIDSLANLIEAYKPDSRR